MKAVIYARVSSVDESQSFDRQLADLQRYAKYKNIKVVNTFAEKISGFRKGLEDRIEFNNMTEYIDKHAIKHILISELSRLSRRYIDSVNFINDCSKQGINIHILKEGISTLNEDGTENSMVQMLIGMLSSMAQQESQSLSYRVKSGKRYAAEQGRSFGYQFGYSKKDGKPIVNEKQAEGVRKMFEMSAQGIGSRTIANYINKHYAFKHFIPSSVQSILKNTFYVGRRRYKDLILDVPPIIDQETFDKCNELIKSRKRHTTVTMHTNPFASFIKCKCGATMMQVVVKSARVNVYQCKDKCGVKSVNRPFLINEVRTVVERNAKQSKEKLVREKLNNKIQADLGDIQVYNKKIENLTSMIDKNYEQFLLGKISESKYNDFNGRFERQLKKTSIATKKLKGSIRDVKNTLKNDIIHYSESLDILKQQLLNTIEYITVQDEIAICKIKGWGKQVINIYRGNHLKKYNDFMKNRT